MTCRHRPGDPDCSSNPNSRNYYANSYDSVSSTPTTPDSKNYNITMAEMVGNYLIIQVKYPNCSSCAYEGTKTLVLANINLLDALKWREIDPHFADPKKKRMAHQAPSPIARFPGSSEGWQDALDYARNKQKISPLT